MGLELLKLGIKEDDNSPILIVDSLITILYYSREVVANAVLDQIKLTGA